MAVAFMLEWIEQWWVNVPGRFEAAHAELVRHLAVDPAVAPGWPVRRTGRG